MFLSKKKWKNQTVLLYIQCLKSQVKRITLFKKNTISKTHGKIKYLHEF